MTSAQVVSFAALIGACVGVVILVFTAAPALARLSFRSKLEAIHDDSVDAVLDRRLSAQPQVKAFISMIDYAAAHARWGSLARELTVIRALDDLGIGSFDHRTDGVTLSFGDLTDGEQRIMDDFVVRLEAAFRSYIIWGSPVGWVLAPLVLLASKLNPEGKFAEAESTIPMAAREAMCSDLSNSPRVAQWVAATTHYASR